MRGLTLVAGLTVVLVLSGTAASQQPALGGGGGRGTPIQSGQTCPPGTTEIRPRSCMALEFPSPSIVDYRPHSTLVTAVHW